VFLKSIQSSAQRDFNWSMWHCGNRIVSPDRINDFQLKVAFKIAIQMQLLLLLLLFYYYYFMADENIDRKNERRLYEFLMKFSLSDNYLYTVILIRLQ